jgi:hypothetical protein
LVQHQYQDAFLKIDSLVKALEQDSEKNGSLLKLVEVMTKLLREEHLIKMVRKAYTSIEISKLKPLLGISGWSD